MKLNHKTTTMNQTISFDADKLKNFRQKQGISKRELEDRVNLSLGHICRLEKGEITLPNIEVVWKLADYFKVDMKEFIKQIFN